MGLYTAPKNFRTAFFLEGGIGYARSESTYTVGTTSNTAYNKGRLLNLAGVWEIGYETDYFAAGLVPLIPVDVFKLALGIIVLVLGLDFAIRPVRKGRGELVDLPDDNGAPLWWGTAGGLGAGITSGLFGTPGPFVT